MILEDSIEMYRIYIYIIHIEYRWTFKDLFKIPSWDCICQCCQMTWAWIFPKNANARPKTAAGVALTNALHLGTGESCGP